jgi:hypothetical protein
MKTFQQDLPPFKTDDGAVPTYEIRPREDHHGVDLISDMLPFGGLLYLEVREAVDYAKFYSSSRDAIIRVYDSIGNVTETHHHKGDLKQQSTVALHIVGMPNKSGMHSHSCNFLGRNPTRRMRAGA